MRKVVRVLLALAACGILVFATGKLADYLRESRESTDLNEILIEEAIAVKEPAPQFAQVDMTLAEPSQADTEDVPGETAPIQVDFDLLAETNSDVIGWLYCGDTPINLPVVQGSDNDYYLKRMFDGTWNSSGTLFADYRMSGDFSDGYNLIYGHNMKNDEMFGTLPNYSQQAYYELHPVMWLLTPAGDYRLELLAGYVTEATSQVYSLHQSETDVYTMVQQAMEQSTFTASLTIAPEDRFVTLSTCSYEYDNARYVLIGRLVPVE